MRKGPCILLQQADVVQVVLRPGTRESLADRTRRMTLCRVSLRGSITISDSYQWSRPRRAISPMYCVRTAETILDSVLSSYTTRTR